MSESSIVERMTVGFYGKLPTHGDFLRRRVTDAFVSVWDTWLQASLVASRDALADRWLDVYLTSPVWRFACAADVAGPRPIVGVMVPSVDRVGRYFPLTLVAELPIGTTLVSLPDEARRFFENAERLVLDALSSDQLDFDTLDNRIENLGEYLVAAARAPGLALGAAASAVMAGDANSRWQLPIGSASEVSVALEQLMERRLTELYAPMVMWWTEGSSCVEPSLLVCSNLPEPDSFAALLDGSWTDRRWRTVPFQLNVTADTAALIDEAMPRTFQSAALSNVGKVRKVNQDSFLERSDVGIWVVADGVGGHSHGEVASRMVCDAIADITPAAGFADVITSVRERVDRVNAYLVAQAGDDDSLRSGSTVVVLLTRGSRCAVLWAGDSRLYRLRDGTLTQVTRDHSVAAAGIDGEEHDSHAITRAVGGDTDLVLEDLHDRVQVGDRFLLCTDGLTREVPDDRIAAHLATGDAKAAADALIAAALAAAARDNVTAVVVDVGA